MYSWDRLQKADRLRIRSVGFERIPLAGTLLICPAGFDSRVYSADMLIGQLVSDGISCAVRLHLGVEEMIVLILCRYDQLSFERK